MSLDLVQSHERRIASLEEEVADLKRRLRDVAGEPGNLVSSHDPPERSKPQSVGLIEDSRFERVRDITVAMFPGEISFEEMFDPEAPQEKFIVFEVAASGSIEELVRRQLEWSDAVLRSVPDASNDYRLSVAPK